MEAERKLVQKRCFSWETPRQPCIWGSILICEGVGSISNVSSPHTALCKAVPQGKRHLDRESAVYTAPRAEKCYFEISWFKM